MKSLPLTPMGAGVWIFSGTTICVVPEIAILPSQKGLEIPWAGEDGFSKTKEKKVYGEGNIADLRCCGVGHFLMRCCGENNSSLQCCGDLKPYGVQCFHFKVYGVR